MQLRKEDEHRLALLAALLHIGGSGTKKEVLDAVADLELMKLTNRQKELKHNRPEVVWRNELAYTKHHLSLEGCCAKGTRNLWAITDSGREYAMHLAAGAINSSDGRHVRLKDAAAVVQVNLYSSANIEKMPLSSVAIEGEHKLVWTVTYERNQQLRAAAIRIHGVNCMACGFSFSVAYGQLGEGYIEVHHLNPISQLESPRQVDAATDLVVLCANCHSMAHRRKGRPYSLDELRESLAQSRLAE
ncbi:MAG: winged helix-turn-helix domain-containing protein [Planctomycetia bacterium]|nr:winged helix-turn-helix domain-containing protein [Planctomycetia bacterium]